MFLRFKKLKGNQGTLVQPDGSILKKNTRRYDEIYKLDDFEPALLKTQRNISNKYWEENPEAYPTARTFTGHIFTPESRALYDAHCLKYMKQASIALSRQSTQMPPVPRIIRTKRRADGYTDIVMDQYPYTVKDLKEYTASIDIPLAKQRSFTATRVIYNNNNNNNNNNPTITTPSIANEPDTLSTTHEADSTPIVSFDESRDPINERSTPSSTSHGFLPITNDDPREYRQVRLSSDFSGAQSYFEKLKLMTKGKSPEDIPTESMLLWLLVNNAMTGNKINELIKWFKLDSAQSGNLIKSFTNEFSRNVVKTLPTISHTEASPDDDSFEIHRIEQEVKKEIKTLNFKKEGLVFVQKVFYCKKRCAAYTGKYAHNHKCPNFSNCHQYWSNKHFFYYISPRLLFACLFCNKHISKSLNVRDSSIPDSLNTVFDGDVYSDFEREVCLMT
ncbi:unnamed protein product [Ambrosiozyma monospora]|uniref:Unnamed protein product n=1 Tax=Ambrosiozyma monospora TaxID=43982 RepID=A0A9W7DGU6_AMBMO|nr:unnamed protein product [Ambrosiozyma monospora]